ncbi:hypothetical protein GCM10010123_16710 [Pilimelia anulata]|uniref:Uncharacterized protein n=1 Tax=Pilimelia anulata TaxID=53371 RepID=A0A8J3F7D3_9ACTN|nr:hypothetical protein [Pilimelia anulata]GGJ87783.1 hypothetical protein GCM10010123_16710 [Pilimelia anulata]
MSHDAPVAGQPPEPWGAGEDAAAERYDEPSDPWGGNGAPLGPWAHPPQNVPPYDPTGVSYAPPAQAAPVDSPAPEWTAPAPPSRGRRSFTVALVMCLLAILAAAGWGVGIYLWGRQGGRAPQAVPTITPPSPTYQPTSPPEPTPHGTDARSVTAGQCLVNRGNDRKPDLRVAACSAAEYQVLARFDGTRDYTKKCKGKIDGYEFYYFFDAAEDSHDFVLCLRRRPAPTPR